MKNFGIIELLDPVGNIKLLEVYLCNGVLQVRNIRGVGVSAVYSLSKENREKVIRFMVERGHLKQVRKVA
jgi:hypothetical protein